MKGDLKSPQLLFMKEGNEHPHPFPPPSEGEDEGEGEKKSTLAHRKRSMEDCEVKSAR